MKDRHYIMEHEKEAERLILQVDAGSVIAKTVSAVIDKYELMLPVGANRLLEAGCGPGHLTVEIAKRHPDLKIVAVDQSERRLSLARAGLSGFKQVTVKNGDITHLKEASNQYGYIFSRFVLDHIKKQQLQAVCEFYRVLKPGGIMILQSVDQGLGVYFPESLRIRWIKKALHRALSKSNYDPDTGRRLASLSKKAGFNSLGGPVIETYKQFAETVSHRELTAFKMKLNIASPVFKQAFGHRILADKVKSYLIETIRNPETLMYSILVTLVAQKPCQ